MSCHRANRRSGPSDTYYDERALHPCTYADDGIVAVRKQYWDQKNREMSSSAHDTRPPAKVRDDDNGRAHATPSQPVRATEAGAFGDTEAESKPDGDREENGRVAEWVQSQQISQHVALPLSLFQDMVKRLIESEEAVEQLRNVAISCIREAYPVWKGPGGVQNDPPVFESEAGMQRKEESFDACTMQTRKHDVDEIKVHTSIADLREGLISRRSLERSDSKTQPFMKDVATFVSFEEPRKPDSRADSLHSGATQPSSGASSRSAKRRLDMLSPTLGDNVHDRQQTDPSSWFYDSSSQGSFGLVASGALCELQDHGVESQEHKEMKTDEANRAVDAAQKSVMGSISVDTLGSQRHAESGSKVEKSSQTSRVVAGFRNGVGRFLDKHRPSRNTLRQCAESERAPIPLPHQELNVYLQIPEDASGVPRAPKMEPRPAMPERVPRAPTSRRSAPHLRT